MCGFPAKDLEKYVEKLREKHDVTISRIGDSGHEHTAYTLPSIDHEAEQAINAYEAEFGADGTRVFRDPAADAPQPTVCLCGRFLSFPALFRRGLPLPAALRSDLFTHSDLNGGTKCLIEKASMR